MSDSWLNAPRHVIAEGVTRQQLHVRDLGPVDCIRWSPDAERLLWTSREVYGLFVAERDGRFTVLPSAKSGPFDWRDAATFCVGNEEGLIERWDWRLRQRDAATPRALAHRHRVSALAHAGGRLFSGGLDDQLFHWSLDLQSRTQLADQTRIFALARSPDGRWLAACSSRGLLVIDVPTLQIVERIDCGSAALCATWLAPQQLLVGTHAGDLRLLDAPHWSATPVGTPASTPIRAVEPLHDSGLVASKTQSGTLTLWRPDWTPAAHIPFGPQRTGLAIHPHHPCLAIPRDESSADLTLLTLDVAHLGGRPSPSPTPPPAPAPPPPDPRPTTIITLHHPVFYSDFVVGNKTTT